MQLQLQQKIILDLCFASIICIFEVSEKQTWGSKSCGCLKVLKVNAQKSNNTPLSSGRIWSFYLFVLWNVMTILSKQKQLLKYELCFLWFTACNYGGPGGYRALHIYAPKVAMEALYLPRSHLWFIVPAFLKNNEPNYTHF